MPKLIRVAVLMGGPSAEHEVSLSSGEKIISALDRQRYEIIPVKISKDGAWPLAPRALKARADIALIAAMHGEYGEDGTLQTILKKAKIPFTGSGPIASRKGMDKVIASHLFDRAGLLTPKFIEYKKRQAILGGIESPFGYPIVVKPTNRGSSVGVTIVRARSELVPALVEGFKFSDRILVQEFITGRELTGGVLEINQKSKALPVTEIVPKTSKFFDYAAKYTAGGSIEITPAKLLPKLTRKIQRAALTAHKTIGASGYSRSDFILTPENELYILEINTLPGMTATSLLPQEAAAADIPFSKLLDLIIAAVLD